MSINSGVRIWDRAKILHRQHLCSSFVLDVHHCSFYDSGMWNASANTIPQSQIKAEHLRVLEEAVKDCEMYDIRSASVYEALDYLQKQTDRTWGFTVFRQALEQWNPSALQEGLKLIKQQFSKN